MTKFLLTLFLSLPVLLFAQNQPIDKISFELTDNNEIFIKCKVNETDSLTFLFDTGANGTVINSYICKLPQK